MITAALTRNKENAKIRELWETALSVGSVRRIFLENQQIQSKRAFRINKYAIV
jgi:hypothetical protein